MAYLVKRVFILGPPGSERKEYAKRCKDKFPIVVIETGALLKKELLKKTEHAEAIKKAFEQRVLGKLPFAIISISNSKNLSV